MNFLLPRFVLLAVMLLSSVWALLNPCCTSSDEDSSRPQVAEMILAEHHEVLSHNPSKKRTRSVGWQMFLPGIVR